MSVITIDSLPELEEGELTALYPEKYIFDMPGFPKILAKDFALRTGPPLSASSLNLNWCWREDGKLD